MDETESDKNENSEIGDSQTVTEDLGQHSTTDNEMEVNKTNDTDEVNIEMDEQVPQKHGLAQNGICFKGNVCVIYESLYFHSILCNLSDKNVSRPAHNVTIKNVTENKCNKEPIEQPGEQPKNVDIKDGTWKGTANDTKTDGDMANKTNLNIQEVEEILSRKKVEYAHKIQQIELQLLKLENRLLTDTLNKQNNSVSYTRLENLILKLENELLKINRSFGMIQEENNQLKAKQLSEKQIYEIFNRAKEENKAVEQKYLALADNSSALGSMVDKQQNKIIELVLMMHNQTDFINRLEEKSQRLEEQNRQLHEVLVNQSNMMSELVKGMKYMKEEQDKLKTTVVQPLPLTTQDPDINAKNKDKSANTDPPIVRDNGNRDEKSEENQSLNKVNIVDVESDNAVREDESKLGKVEPSPKDSLAHDKRREDAEKSEEINILSTSENRDEPKSVSEQEGENTKQEVKQPEEAVYLTKKTKSKKSTHKVVIPDTPKYFSPKLSGPKGKL